VKGISPTVRGLAIVVLVAAAITAAGAEEGLTYVFLVLQILFLVAIAIALYRLWRRNRQEISVWSARSRIVFYAAAILAIADIVASFVLPYPSGGLESLIFFAVLAACAFSMWRVWRDEHTYG
jgi:fucose 4-O-acetylase-like acetyltransferase